VLRTQVAEIRGGMKHTSDLLSRTDPLLVRERAKVVKLGKKKVALEWSLKALGESLQPSPTKRISGNGVNNESPLTSDLRNCLAALERSKREVVRMEADRKRHLHALESYKVYLVAYEGALAVAEKTA